MWHEITDVVVVIKNEKMSQSQIRNLNKQLFFDLDGKLPELFLIILLILQEEKLEDDPFPVNVPADPSEYRHAIPVPQLHLLITARELPWLPEGHY